MNNSVKFWTPGAPAPQGSKRHVGNGRMIESSKAVGPWRERVALAADEAMRNAGYTGPFMGPIMVRSDFVLPRPKSAPKAKFLAATKRPDADKLVRAVFDALTGVTFCDDSQVVGLAATKQVALHGHGPGCYIVVTEMP